MNTSIYTSDVLEYRISRVSLREDGILDIKIKADELFTASDYYDLMDAAYTFGKGKRLLNLIDVGEHTTADHESRKLSTSKEGSIYKLADSFIIYSLPQKLVANFYMSFHKPIIPTRFNTSKDEAIKWLKNMDQNLI